MKKLQAVHLSLLALSLLASGCLSTVEPLILSEDSPTTVKFDFLHKPLPEIPLPNDIATRYDAQSATKRRINASMIAPTSIESNVRKLIDELDGWGVGQPITIPFTAPIDLHSLLAGHRDPDFKSDNDVIYLINITPSSPNYGKLTHIDFGMGNFPVVLERIDAYWEHDPRGWTNSLLFDEENEDKDGDGELGWDLEDTNGNGQLDPGEDLDMDGVLDYPEDTDADGYLDRPNYLPCGVDHAKDLACDENLKIPMPARDDLRGRADSLMSFYERESNTLILRQMMPLDERTTYAVVVTRRLLDENGQAIGSPFQGIHHTSQKDALKNLPGVLPKGLLMEDIAFTFTFTTQSLSSHFVAVREGLYGHGVQKHLAEEYPAEMVKLFALRDTNHPNFTGKNPYIMEGKDWLEALTALAPLLGLPADSRQFKAQRDSQKYVGFHVVGSFIAPQLFSRSPLNDSVTCEEACAGFAGCGDRWNSNEEFGSVESCIEKCKETQKWGAQKKLCYQRLAGRCESVAVCQDGTSNLPTFNPTVDPRQPKTLVYCPPALEGKCDSASPNINEWQSTNDQSWPADLDIKPVKATPEEIPFWLMIPHKSVRKPGAVPISIIGHGYGSNRFEALAFAGFFAQFGVATLAIDCPSHGLELSDNEKTLATTLTTAYGLKPLFEAMFKARAIDQNFDGRRDSGADFWTSYVFHTRDVVRQCVLDHLSLIRLIKSFDGKKKWNFEGMTDILAGDFDGDGELDVSADSPISVSGGSLGGITSTMIGSLEPAIDLVLPISGGGGLGDIGMRSVQGGVKEAVILRVMGPVFSGEPSGSGLDAKTRIFTLMTELKGNTRVEIAHITQLKAWDTVVVKNLDNGGVSCGYVAENGTFRISLESDIGDRIELDFYDGPQLVGGNCLLKEKADKALLQTVNQFQTEAKFMGKTYAAGSPLLSLMEGFGEKRATPGFRRFLGIGQLVLDGGDPASYAKHLSLDPLHYPNMNDTTSTHAIIITTMGDMNVPANAGLNVARAAGLIDYTTPVPEYGGRTMNQVIVEGGGAEAVHTISRFKDKDGNPVHLDLENFSQDRDIHSFKGIPRLDPPIHSKIIKPDPIGGISGAIFPYPVPEGQHGFNFPGGDQDLFIAKCRSACTEGDQSCQSKCGEAYRGWFDIGFFMFGMLAEYMSAQGKVMPEYKQCYSTNDCPGFLPPPEE